MIARYHQDQYLFEFDTVLTKVVLQEKFVTTIGHGTQEKKICNGVVLEDTIMFPEGGGQPPDHGTLTFEVDGKPIDAKVWYVLKRQGEIVHLIEDGVDVKDLPLGTKVHQKLDQARRLYHMKQHTCQHLISCIGENEFQLDTVSWHLGSEISHIELSIKNCPLEEVVSKMNEVERMANSYIRKKLTVTAKFIPTDHPDLKKVSNHTGLPKDHVGDVRLCEIEGLDLNMCCGTLVSNLSDLEVVKLLGCKMKKKGYCFAYFVAGEEYFNRVFNSIKDREAKICTILNTNPEDCVNKIKDQKEKLAAATKKNKALMEANAKAQLEIFKLKHSKIPLFSFHSADGAMDLLCFIALQRKEMDMGNLTTLLLTCGEGEEVSLFISASQDIMDKLMPQMSSVGAFGKNLSEFRYQGKVPLKSRPALESLIEETLKNKLNNLEVV